MKVGETKYRTWTDRETGWLWGKGRKGLQKSAVACVSYRKEDGAVMLSHFICHHIISYQPCCQWITLSCLTPGYRDSGGIAIEPKEEFMTIWDGEGTDGTWCFTFSRERVFICKIELTYLIGQKRILTVVRWYSSKVYSCVWLLINCPSALRPCFSILLCDLRAETLKTTFPSLPCQLPTRSVSGQH